MIVGRYGRRGDLRGTARGCGDRHRRACSGAETDVGLNDALAPVGSPLAVNVTLPGNAPPTVAVAIVKFADWPAVVVCVVVVAVTLKSVIVNVNAFEVPPPGVGFTTVIAAVPLVAMSVAVIAAVN